MTTSASSHRIRTPSGSTPQICRSLHPSAVHGLALMLFPIVPNIRWGVAIGSNSAGSATHLQPLRPPFRLRITAEGPVGSCLLSTPDGGFLPTCLLSGRRDASPSSPSCQVKGLLRLLGSHQHRHVALMMKMGGVQSHGLLLPRLRLPTSWPSFGSMPQASPCMVVVS